MLSENHPNNSPEIMERRKKRQRTAMAAAETSSRRSANSKSPAEEMNAYITEFPESPEGTVKTWKQYEKKAMTTRAELANIAFDDDDSEGSQLEKNRQAKHLAAALKSAINNIDMKVDWSKVDKYSQKVEPPMLALSVYEHVAMPIQERTTKLQTTSELLKSMSRYSNKTETKTFVTDTRCEGPTEEFEMCEIKEMMAGVKMPSPSKEEQVLQDAMNKDCAQPWWTNQEEIEDLQQFSNFLGDLLSGVTLLAPLKVSESTQWKHNYKHRMEETAQRILDWKCSSVVPQDKIFYFPNETSAEKQAVQPILYSILRALATTDKESSGEDSMYIRNGEDIHRERTYPPIHLQQSKRQIDFEAGAVRQYTPLALPMTATQIPMEVKNVARKNQNAESMHFEVIKQVVGHCSKKVSIAFDIGNIGVDGSSTAIILTPVFVQAVQICLKGTGSDNVKIVTNFSKMFPLVSSATFKKLVTVKQNQDYLYPKLFPTNEVEPTVPAGLRHLRDLARASEQDLGGVFLNTPSANATFQEFRTSLTGDGEEFVDGPQIEKLIGSGAHGLVYAVSSSTSNCVKASRVGEISHIKRELETLRLFAADSAAPDQIPHLLGMGRLNYNIRESAVTVPAFLFEPRGISAAATWKNFCADRENLIKHADLIWEHISLALNFSHKKNIFHLDPRLPNFIWDPAKKVYILGDWSSSAVILGNKGIKGFRGALPFASARVHVLSYNKGWMPKKQHDFASLGLSIASFLSGQSVPWSGFYKRFGKSDEDRFEQRRKIASGILTEHNMKQEIVDSFNKEDQEGHLH